MTRSANHALAALAVCLLSFAAINAMILVPPAQAAALAAVAPAELA